MNNREDKNAKLLAETFHEDWTDGRASQFARHAAAHARLRRRVRRAVYAAGAAAVVAAAALVSFQRPEPVAAPTATTAPAPSARGYEIISDEQLLAQLRDRPLLVVKKADGSREIVLLENE